MQDPTGTVPDPFEKHREAGRIRFRQRVLSEPLKISRPEPEFDLRCERDSEGRLQTARRSANFQCGANIRTGRQLR